MNLRIVVSLPTQREGTIKLPGSSKLPTTISVFTRLMDAEGLHIGFGFAKTTACHPLLLTHYEASSKTMLPPPKGFSTSKCSTVASPLQSIIVNPPSSPWDCGYWLDWHPTSAWLECLEESPLPLDEGVLFHQPPPLLLPLAEKKNVAAQNIRSQWLSLPLLASSGGKCQQKWSC